MRNCPECGRIDACDVIRAIELPPDNRSDEISLQVLECEACGYRGLGAYQESRRGALDSESWEYEDFDRPVEVVDRIAALIAACPEPLNRHCPCPAHLELGRQVDGYWIRVPEDGPGTGSTR